MQRILICFLIIFQVSFCLNQIKDNIYLKIPDIAVSHCVKRINNTDAVGCSSKKGGNIGELVVAYNFLDLQTKILNLKKYSIVLINSEIFIEKELQNTLNNKFITGLLVYQHHSKYSFSEDYLYPNDRYSFNRRPVYNPYGSHYAFRKWNYPVALLKDDKFNIQKNLIDCYEKYNLNETSKFKCSVEINNLVAGTDNANVCLRKNELHFFFAVAFNMFSFCGNMSGYNYMIYSRNITTPRKNNSVIIISAQMDSISMFEKSASNVPGELTSTSVLISLMNFLMIQPHYQNYSGNGTNGIDDVIFLFLDNDAWDYLGSSSFLFMLERGKLGLNSPIKPQHIRMFIHLGELGYLTMNNLNLFLKNISGPQEERLLKELKQSNFVVNSNLTEYYPPSPVQYMLHQQMDWKFLVISDYSKVFCNPHYHSFFSSQLHYSNATTKQETSLVFNNLVEGLARFLYKEITNLTLNDTIYSNNGSVSAMEIIECLTANLSCSLLHNVYSEAVIRQSEAVGFPIPAQDHSSSPAFPENYKLSLMLQDVIIYLSGTEKPINDCKACSNCKHTYIIHSAANPNPGRCYFIKMERQDVGSFPTPNNDLPVWLASSIIGEQTIRIFLVANHSQLLILGLLLTLAATIIVAFYWPHMDRLFTNTNQLY